MDLLLRLPRAITVGGRRYDVLKEHSDLLTQNGSVALGKFGARLSERVMNQLARELSVGSPRLHIAIKRGNTFEGVSTRISSARHDPSGRSADFPAYYAALHEAPASYLILTSPFVRSDLHELRLVSNGRPVLDVLQESRTVTMLVSQLAQTAAAPDR